MLKEEAKNKECPYKNSYCCVDECMAWVSDYRFPEKKGYCKLCNPEFEYEGGEYVYNSRKN
jgi:hypothetical protein